MYSAYTLYVYVCACCPYAIILPSAKGGEKKNVGGRMYILEGQEREGRKWARVSVVQRELWLLANKQNNVL